MTKINFCTFYIVRHGATDWNAQRKIQGQTDISLNDLGVEQAKDLGNILKDINFDKVYSSDLIRAKKTAEIIVLEKEIAVETTKALRERRFGQLEGKSSDILKKLEKNLNFLTRQVYMDFRHVEDSESNQEIVTRFSTFIREVAVTNPGKIVLVVTHSGIIRNLIFQFDFEKFIQPRVGNTAYIKLESDGVDFFIKEIKGITKAG